MITLLLLIFFSRCGGIRTPRQSRFWRPLLYQLSHAPIIINNKKQPLLISFLSEDAVENAGNFVMRKFLHQQIKQYIFLSCLLSDHELLDCLLHLFTLRIIIYSFLQFFCIQSCNKSDTVVL